MALSLASAVFLLLFFSYPFARPVLLPAAVVILTTSFVSPPLGLGVFLISTLYTLQLPILLGLPYFTAPEPLFFSFLLGFSLYRLRHPFSLHIPSAVRSAMLVFALAVMAGSLLVWLSLWQLPGPWVVPLTLDGLQKIIFWRWENPLQFFRVGLLYLEGLLAFIAVIGCHRVNARLTLLTTLGGLFALAFSLAGYSAIELLLRGKEISVYPGFGPVFTDRNAYAAFWVMIAPLSLAVALGSRGWLRMGGFVLTFLASLFCFLSLSVTGIGTLAAALVFCIFLFHARALRRFAMSAVLALLALCALGGLLWLSQPVELKKSIGARLEERFSFWLPASAMIRERPLLGVGPGEFNRLLTHYRQKTGTTAESRFTAENVHNYFLQVGVDTGLVGLGGFLGVLFVVGGVVYRSRSGESFDRIDREPAPAESPDSSRFLAWWIARLPGRGPLTNGLTAALVGILLFSLTQHPMLRFVFQIYFWALLGLLLGLVSGTAPRGEVAAGFRMRPGLSVLLVLSAGLLQWLMFPQTDRTEFRYGLTVAEADGEAVWHQTAGLAALRTPVPESVLELILQAHPDSPGQNVRVLTAGRQEELRVDQSQETSVLIRTDEGALEFALITRPVVPESFPSDWGAGVKVRGLPAEEEE